MTNLILQIVDPEICYAIDDPWTNFATSSVDQMSDLFPLFSTPVGFIISVLCICLVLAVIIKSISK